MSKQNHKNHTNDEYDDLSLMMRQPRPINQMKFSLLTNFRKIMLWDEITDDSIFEAVYGLYKIMDLDRRRLINKQDRQPIEIHIKSNGGDCEAGFALISLMEEMKSQGYIIKTFNDSCCYSMGLTIFLAGSERISYRRSRFMYHDVASGTYGKYEEMADSLTEILSVRKNIDEIIMKYTNITQSEIDSIHSHKTDKYFSAQELMERKGVDRIIE